MTLTQWLDCLQLSAEDRRSATVIAAHVLNKPKTWILAHGDHPLAESEFETLNKLADRLRTGEPLAYIIGKREFYGRMMTVSPAVLIPRPETEILIDACLALPLPSDASVIDIGTGSGCIAITLQLERPNWNVIGSDLSPEALQIAQQNSSRLQAHVRWISSDLLASKQLPGRFDLLVSNPPYVGNSDQVGPGVAEFEPHVALFAGDDGLEIYRRLADEARNRATFVTLEIGQGQEDQVAHIFRQQGWKTHAQYNDLAAICRVLVFRN